MKFFKSLRPTDRHETLPWCARDPSRVFFSLAVRDCMEAQDTSDVAQLPERVSLPDRVIFRLVHAERVFLQQLLLRMINAGMNHATVWITDRKMELQCLDVFRASLLYLAIPLDQPQLVTGQYGLDVHSFRRICKLHNYTMGLDDVDVTPALDRLVHDAITTRQAYTLPHTVMLEEPGLHCRYINPILFAEVDWGKLDEHPVPNAMCSALCCFAYLVLVWGNTTGGQGQPKVFRKGPGEPMIFQVSLGPEKEHVTLAICGIQGSDLPQAMLQAIMDSSVPGPQTPPGEVF